MILVAMTDVLAVAGARDRNGKQFMIHHYWNVKPRLHDTTGCETGWTLTNGWTTGCIMYTNVQPVVQPVVHQPVVQPLVRFDNRGWTTGGLTTAVEQPVASCKRLRCRAMLLLIRTRTRSRPYRSPGQRLLLEEPAPLLLCSFTSELHMISFSFIST